MHNWMPYEAKRSRAGYLVWWPAVLMRLADRCCERVPPPDMHPGLPVIQKYGLLTLRLDNVNKSTTLSLTPEFGEGGN